MGYIKSDFYGENLRLRRTPTNAAETYNKLLCLQERDERHNGADPFCVHAPSKRRARLIRMYWAFTQGVQQ